MSLKRSEYGTKNEGHKGLNYADWMVLIFCVFWLCSIVVDIVKSATKQVEPQVESTASATPDQALVCEGDTVVSKEELETLKADARRLRENLGLAPDDIILTPAELALKLAQAEHAGHNKQVDIEVAQWAKDLGQEMKRLEALKAEIQALKQLPDKVKKDPPGDSYEK